jgi:putative spermidine/putrescine transport system permease protein
MTSMAPPKDSAAHSTQGIPRRTFRLSFDWIGLVPFFAFIAAFLLFPALSIILRALTDGAGSPTFSNLINLTNPVIVQAYRSSIIVSIITAVSGAVGGGLLAWAVTLGGLPRWISNSVLSFSGVAANFAGIPLVFAFSALLGRLGLINVLLRPTGVSIDPQTYLYSMTGLCIVYTYFQIPLMLLIMTPALQGLRKEWREAAYNLGATQGQYWRYVAFPILMPSILGALALLFVNAFSTYATTAALLGAMAQTFAVTIVIANQFRTDTFGDPGLGYALAFSMMLVIGATILIYSYSRRRAERWLRRSE